MRALSLLSLVFLLALAGCGTRDVGPTVIEGALDGNWVTPNGDVGAGKSLVLTSSQGQVAGTGQDFDVQHQIIGNYTIIGTYDSAGINLSMAYDDGSSATFRGQFVGTDTVKGTWTGRNGGQVTLVRVS
jgi:hypothetical protein